MTDAWSHDGKHLPGLLERARVRLSEVYADAAYLSQRNAAAIRVRGAVPFLRPKSTTRGAPRRGRQNRDGAHSFQLMIDAFKSDQAGWLKQYGRRNTVESVFGAIKRRFGPAVGAATPRNRRIETCLKVVVWNLTRIPINQF